MAAAISAPRDAAITTASAAASPTAASPATVSPTAGNGSATAATSPVSASAAPLPSPASTDLAAATCELIDLDKSSPADETEYYSVLESVKAAMNNHLEDYTHKRVLANKPVITFQMIGAQKIVNRTLTTRFDACRARLRASTAGDHKRTSEELRVQFGFHGTAHPNIAKIARTGLLMVGHELNPSKSTDPGWFGSPKKGVYLSRYIDYALKYSNQCQPLDTGDTVKVVMFKCVPGRSLHIPTLKVGMDPTPGYDSHSSPNHLEWYVFQSEQCVPVYVIHIKAVEETRIASDDGKKSKIEKAIVYTNGTAPPPTKPPPPQTVDAKSAVSPASSSSAAPRTTSGTIDSRPPPTTDTACPSDADAKTLLADSASSPKPPTVDSTALTAQLEHARQLLRSSNAGDATRGFAMMCDLAKVAHLPAIAAVADCYLNGTGVRKNELSAVEWLQKGAALNDAACQASLAVCYRDGVGVPRNNTKAFQYAKWAADQNHSPALNTLAVCYATGAGVPKDDKLSLACYVKAVELGNGLAAFNLGRRYETGQGVTKNLATAIDYYRKGAANGSGKAKLKLAELTKK